MADVVHEVVIAGGGPAGMMLAAELALAKIDVAVVERRPDQVLADARARGIHSRTIEILDQRGVADRFLAEGQTFEVATFGTSVVDISDLPTRHPYTLAPIPEPAQVDLTGWVAKLACPSTAGARSTGSRRTTPRGRPPSVRRRADAGALPRRRRWRTKPDPQGSRHRVPGLGCDEEHPDRRGRADRGVPASARRDGRPWAPSAGRREDAGSSRPSSSRGRRRTHPARPQQALIAVFGTDFGVHSPTWITRFTDVTRQAAAYRAGRVLLAGDAAHVHSRRADRDSASASRTR